MSYSITVTYKQAEQAEIAGALVRKRTIYFAHEDEIGTLITNLHHDTPNKERGQLRAHNALIQKVTEMKTHPSDYRYFGDFQRLIVDEQPAEAGQHEMEIDCTVGQTKLLRSLDMGELGRMSSFSKKAALVFAIKDEAKMVEFLQEEYDRRIIGGEKRILSTILAKMGKAAPAPEVEGGNGELTERQYIFISCVAKLMDITVERERPHFSSRVDVTKTINAFRDLTEAGMAKQANLKIVGQLETLREEIPVDTAAFKAMIDEMKKPEVLPDPVEIESDYEEPVMDDDDMKALLTSARTAYYTQGPDMEGPSQADLDAIEDEYEGIYMDEPSEDDSDLYVNGELYIDDLLEPKAEPEQELAPVPDSISLDEYHAEEEPYCDTCGEELDFCECHEGGLEDDCCVMQRIINTISYFGRDRVESWGAVFSDHDDYEVFYTQADLALAFADQLDEAMGEIPEDDETALERIGDELEGIRRQAY